MLPLGQKPNNPMKIMGLFDWQCSKSGIALWLQLEDGVTHIKG